MLNSEWFFSPRKFNLVWLKYALQINFRQKADRNYFFLNTKFTPALKFLYLLRPFS